MKYASLPHSFFLTVSGSIDSASRSTRAALSPFQSQYLVFITADCSEGGEHINTETCSYYVTLPFLHHTPFQPLSLFILSFPIYFHPLPCPWRHRVFICFLMRCLYSICSLLHFFFLYGSIYTSLSILTVYLCLSSGRQ